ncbi:MAG: hypothetical protein ACLP1D_24380 [Xanthobacteraceae bacterium]
MRSPADSYRDLGPGLLNGLLYFAVVLVGCGYILFSKLYGFGAFFVTAIPIVVMLCYALLLLFARPLRLRDDQSGDNLYYMGFLFTLTSLAVSLYQFSATGSAEQIVQNFGVAIASTISGIALRIFFNQMRRDPIEVEHTARLELAEASRKVKRELDSTVLEFSYFRRATQQSISDALDEVNELLAQAKDRLLGQLDDFAATSSQPLAEASRRSGDAIEDLNSQISNALGTAVSEISAVSGELSHGTAALIQSIDGVVAKLATLQTPDDAAEMKLAPMIQALSRAVAAFSKSAEAQAKAVDASLEQTEVLSNAITMLLAEMRNAEIARADAAAAAEARRPYKSRSTARASDPGLQPSLWSDVDKRDDG